VQIKKVYREEKKGENKCLTKKIIL